MISVGTKTTEMRTDLNPTPYVLVTTPGQLSIKNIISGKEQVIRTLNLSMDNPVNVLDMVVSPLGTYAVIKLFKSGMELDCIVVINLQNLSEMWTVYIEGYIAG